MLRSMATALFPAALRAEETARFLLLPALLASPLSRAGPHAALKTWSKWGSTSAAKARATYLVSCISGLTAVLSDAKFKQPFTAGMEEETGFPAFCEAASCLHVDNVYVLRCKRKGPDLTEAARRDYYLILWRYFRIVASGLLHIEYGTAPFTYEVRLAVDVARDPPLGQNDYKEAIHALIWGKRASGKVDDASFCYLSPLGESEVRVVGQSRLNGKAGVFGLLGLLPLECELHATCAVLDPGWETAELRFPAQHPDVLRFGTLLTVTGPAVTPRCYSLALRESLHVSMPEMVAAFSSQEVGGGAESSSGSINVGRVRDPDSQEDEQGARKRGTRIVRVESVHYETDAYGHRGASVGAVMHSLGPFRPSDSENNLSYSDTRVEYEEDAPPAHMAQALDVVLFFPPLFGGLDQLNSSQL